MGRGEVVGRLRRSTVHVRTEGARNGGAGSGVIWQNDGVIVTNAHVAGNGVGLSVELWDGRRFPARLKGSDPGKDLAALSIETDGLPGLPVRESPAKEGETALAIGNPLGFTGAMTTGVVKGLGPVRGLGRREWVQTAVQLAPGNSGGPLADVEGRLLGINAMVVTGGIALSVPALVARNFIRNGPPPRLGIVVREVSVDRSMRGLLILGVEAGSLAERVSLMIGDVLTRLNGVALEPCDDLTAGLAQPRTEYARVQFLRGGRSNVRQVSIRLRERPAQEFAA